MLWSPQSGPICAYEDPTLAWAHAATMLGVDVAQTALREELPEVAREDIERGYDDEDTTPITVEEIDDAPDAPKT